MVITELNDNAGFLQILGLIHGFDIRGGARLCFDLACNRIDMDHKNLRGRNIPCLHQIGSGISQNDFIQCASAQIGS